MKKNELLKYVGDASQLFGIRDYTFNQGKAKGVRGIDINNGYGLQFTVLPDRGLDIAWLSYKGVNYSYISKTGIVSPYFFNEQGIGFLRNFFAGFLTTCGLTYMGEPGEDNGQILGVHGRISNTPAEEVNTEIVWNDESPLILVKGKMRESTLFGENIVLKREIVCPVGEDYILLNDIVENEGFVEQPLMILYHYNFGYPLLDENSMLLIPDTEVTPRDETAKKGINEYNVFMEPTHGYNEQVFYHNLSCDNAGNTFVGLINNETGFGVKINFNKNELKMLTQWKQMGEGEYVLGLEPCNSPVEGRAKARKEGKLEFIKPGEKRTFSFKIEFINE